MLVYLNPPRSFWQIPDTTIGVSRFKPTREITESDLEGLSSGQRLIFDKAMKFGILSKIDAPQSTSLTVEGNDLLHLPAMELHRRYVSKFVLAKDCASLKKLLTAAKDLDEVKTDVIAVLENGLKRILEDNPEEKFYQHIEMMADDPIETTEDPKPAPKSKGRLRTKKIEMENQ